VVWSWSDRTATSPTRRHTAATPSWHPCAHCCRRKPEPECPSPAIVPPLLSRRLASSPFSSGMGRVRPGLSAAFPRRAEK
jgi:hypothetical protein